MFKADSNLFTITPNLPTETLVLNSYETFSSVRTLLLNLSNDLTGEHRPSHMLTTVFLRPG
jgi:hypothetical protein